MSNGNFLVWADGTGTIFEDETQAMDYIIKYVANNPNVMFKGWMARTKNSIAVTVLTNADGSPTSGELPSERLVEARANSIEDSKGQED